MSYFPVNSGTYTPTLTHVQNVSASTAYVCHWTMTGDVYTVSGKVDIDPTLSSTSTRIGISLPVSVTLDADSELVGTAACPNVDGLVAAIIGDDTNDRAQLQYETTDTANRSFYFTFSFRM